MSKPKATRPAAIEGEVTPLSPTGEGFRNGAAPRAPSVSFHPGMVVVNVTVDVRDGEGHKINERTMPPISINYPYGETVEQVIAALVAQAAQEYQS